MHINTEYIRTVVANTRTFVWYTSIARMHNNFFLCVSRYICICGTSTFEQLYLKVKIDGTDTNRINVDHAIYFSITVSRWWFQIFLLFSPRTLGKIPILTSIFFRWVETTNQISDTPWKIKRLEPTNHPWKERKMIWTKPPWLCSMLIFRGVILVASSHHDFFSLTDP